MILTSISESDLRLIMPLMPEMTYEQMHERIHVWEGRHVALRVEGQLIACGGLTVFWKGVAEAWLQVTTKAKPHTIALCRALVAWIPATMTDLGLHRIQALVREDDDKAHRLMRHLGWTCEGCLRQGAPDRTDLYLYALVREKGD